MPKGVYIRTEKMKANMKGHTGVYVRTKEYRKSLSKGLKGRHLSEQHRQNISKGGKGIKELPISEQGRQNMSEGQKKVWAKRSKEERREYCKPWILAGQANPSSIEKAIRKVLDEFDVNYETHVSFDNSRFVVDIYIPAQRLIIECNGDYWHNLPKIKERDKRLKKYTKNHNYKLIELWESEIRKNPEQALKDGFEDEEKKDDDK